MKKVLFCAILSLFISCSSSNEDTIEETNESEYALTAKIDGEDFLANSAFGDNNFSSTNIYNYYPLEDFVMLQAREDLSFAKEINIWLKRTDIVVGLMK